MKLYNPPAIGFSSVLDLLKLELGRRGKTSDEVDEIIKKENDALTSKYNKNIKEQFHTADVMAAYNSYKSDVMPMIEEIRKLSSESNASKNKVHNAKRKSGSNSESEISASESGSNARTRIDELEGKIKIREKEYDAEKLQAIKGAAKELIQFYDLQDLTRRSGGFKKTRRLRNKKTRKMRK